MATPRKSALQVKARELARERAAAYLRRQDTLLDLAEAFYAKQAELDGMAEAEAARIEAIRLETARESLAVVQSMADAVAAMVATGEPVAAIAERLGIKPKEVRSLADGATDNGPDTSGPDTSAADSAEESNLASGNFGEDGHEPSAVTGDGDQEQSAA